jgi:hypothetical protein
MVRTLSKLPFMLPQQRQRFSNSEDSVSTKITYSCLALPRMHKNIAMPDLLYKVDLASK